MAIALSLDTTLLIDLQRERGTGAEGPAHAFLRRDPDAELFLSVIVLGEFAEGFASSQHPAVQMVRDQHTLLPIDTETALIYSGLTRELRQAGRLIGTNDLWIAASSMRHQLPLVTANTGHFDRVDGLTVLPFRDSPNTPAVSRPRDEG
jgi:predicted nucleic acid-binding protein